MTLVKKGVVLKEEHKSGGTQLNIISTFVRRERKIVRNDSEL